MIMHVMPMEYRKQLCESDIRFVSRCLTRESGNDDAFLRLLTDPETVDSILDHPTLLEQVLNHTGHLPLSPRLYFYLLTRHALKHADLDSPELADYISGILQNHLNSGFHPPTMGSVFYVVDWFNRVQSSPDGRRYELYVMAGNHILFLTGIFPHFLERRTRRRGAPNIDFYESIGQHSFRAAAEHPQCRQWETEQLFIDMAVSFPELRRALNNLADRLIFLDAI